MTIAAEQSPLQLIGFRHSLLRHAQVVLIVQALCWMLVLVDNVFFKKPYQQSAVIIGLVGLFFYIASLLLFFWRGVFERADCLNCGTVNELTAARCSRCNDAFTKVHYSEFRASAVAVVAAVLAVVNFALALNWAVKWIAVVTYGVEAWFFRYIGLEMGMIAAQIISAAYLLHQTWEIAHITERYSRLRVRLPLLVVVMMGVALLLNVHRIATPERRHLVRLNALHNLEQRSGVRVRAYVGELREQIRKELANDTE